MEADMVQAIFLTGAVELCPVVRLHGGIACQRKDAAFQRAPEENGLSGGGAVKMDAGVGSLSRGEYDRICRMVAKGERISFG